MKLDADEYKILTAATLTLVARSHGPNNHRAAIRRWTGGTHQTRDSATDAMPLAKTAVKKSNCLITTTRPLP